MISVARPDVATMIRPDEKAVMTYLSCFYHAFQGLHQVKHSYHHRDASTNLGWAYIICFFNQKVVDFLFNVAYRQLFACHELRWALNALT